MAHPAGASPDQLNRREKLRLVAELALGDPFEFSRLVVRRPLYPHQMEAVRGIVPHIYSGIRTPQFTVMMARQGGKNEMSAQLEGWLLNRHRKTGGQIVKSAPTFKPQIVTSKTRLEEILNNWWNAKEYKTSFGYMVTLGKAKVLFFSTDPQANVVGATASLLMEVDEAQDVDQVVFDKNFAPMRATRNSAIVYYGTAWTSDTLLAQMKDENRALEKSDGIRRHYEYNWEAIAANNPRYQAFVEGQIAKMGEDHPIVKTQYRLLEIDAEGALFPPEQLGMMQGNHLRERFPSGRGRGFKYVAGVDIAGTSEQKDEDILRRTQPRKDSTVITIARLDWSTSNDLLPYPRLQIVDHYWWTGRGHAQQLGEMLQILDTVWHCDTIVSDAGGVGAGITNLLQEHLGGRVIPYHPNPTTKSEIGFELLAAVNTNRIKMYSELEMSPEAKEFWFEMEEADYEMHGMQKMRFFVPEEVGHDDFLSSLSLCAWAGRFVSRGVDTESVELFARGRR